MMDSKRYYAELAAQARDTITYISNQGKPGRERDVCRAFLRIMDIAFCDDDIIASTTEPIDIKFKTARFQIRESMDPGRKRMDEWKEKEKLWSQCQDTEETIESTPMDMSELISIVTDDLMKKVESYKKTYGQGKCGELDALVYMNRMHPRRHLYPTIHQYSTEGLEAQGWRSVSVLFVPHAVVLVTQDNAPDFLKSMIRQIKSKTDFNEISRLFQA